VSDLPRGGPIELPEGGLSDGVVTLRYWTEDDIPALVTAVQDEEITRWLPLIPQPYGDEQARMFLSETEDERKKATGLHLAAVDSEFPEALLGSLAAQIHLEDASCHVGYWVAAGGYSQRGCWKQLACTGWNSWLRSEMSPLRGSLRTVDSCERADCETRSRRERVVATHMFILCWQSDVSTGGK
jgi:Acetyltransferase (GNAT) domain